MFDDFRKEDPADIADVLVNPDLPATVYRLLVETATKFGEKKAWHFIDTECTRSWAEVLDLVDEAAAALTVLGVREGSHVAMMATTIEEFVLVWLASSRLGAVLVPVNSRYTAVEVDYALTTSDARFFLIEDRLAGVLEEMEREGIADSHIVVVGNSVTTPFQSWREIVASARYRTSIEAEPDTNRLVNLQYTSGTTGFSKACMLSNRYWLVIGLLHRTISACELHRLYANFSFFYMVSPRILVQAMFDGACVVFPRIPVVDRFIDDVTNARCDYASPLLALTKQPSRLDEKLSFIKVGMSGLGNMSKGEQSAFHARFDFPVQNIYGLTEIGVATYVPAHRIMELEDTDTIGVAPPNREVRICDEEGREMPVGEVGEICVRGDGMFQGYYGMAEATAAVFHGEWFRTGDLGWADETGLFFLVGRSKDMVRRGAENVSAVEVETVVRMLPGIAEAAVVAVPDPVTEEEVKLYVQLAPFMTPVSLPPERILEHCSSHLAAFKVPRYLEYRDGFPMTESFRVQKKKLIAEKEDLRVGSFDRRAGEWL